jgi:uncharacterized Zn-binding protein involved in type VI secretion
MANTPKVIKRFGREKTINKGSWTVGIDGKEVPFEGKETVVTKDGVIIKKKFKAVGNAPDGAKIKIKDKTRIAGGSRR